VRWFGAGLPRVTGDDEEEEYTALVFDNRGVGNSIRGALYVSDLQN
jgi:hypothetical protein